MRELFVFVMAASLAVPALAQRGGGFRGGGGARMGGGIRGGVPVRGGGIHAGGGIGFRSPGFGVRGGVHFGNWSRPGFGYYDSYRTSWWPAPLWYGGYVVSGFSNRTFVNPWEYPPSPYPQYPMYVSAPAAPANAPVVIINQIPPAPVYEPRIVYRERAPEPEGQFESGAPVVESYRPIIYRIAFNDGRSLAALAYWVRNQSLHYVTTDYVVHESPLKSVDRVRSRELNRDSGVTLRLPPAD